MCAYGAVCVSVCSHEFGIVGNDVLLEDVIALLGLKSFGHGSFPLGRRLWWLLPLSPCKGSGTGSGMGILKGAGLERKRLLFASLSVLQNCIIVPWRQAVNGCSFLLATYCVPVHLMRLIAFESVGGCSKS